MKNKRSKKIIEYLPDFILTGILNIVEIMKTNIGNVDRGIRFGLAAILFGYAVYASSFFALLLSLFTLYEAIGGWCAYYQLVGKSSCPISKSLPYQEWVFGALGLGFILDGLWRSYYYGDYLFALVDVLFAIYMFYLAFKK